MTFETLKKLSTYTRLHHPAWSFGVPFLSFPPNFATHTMLVTTTPGIALIAAIFQLTSIAEASPATLSGMLVHFVLSGLDIATMADLKLCRSSRECDSQGQRLRCST